MRPVICVLAMAMVLVGGCSARRVNTPTFGAAPTVTTTPFSSVPTGPVAPAKYTKAIFESCLDIKQKMGGDLPPAQPNDFRQTSPSGSSWTCTYKGTEQTVVLGFQSWENMDNVGLKSGAEYAAEYFAERTKSWEQDTGVKIGSDARWRNKHATACALEILDENGVLTVSRSSGTEVGFDEEQCRVAVRELAKKFFAAVQP